jgi:hypothetical protein
MRMSAGRWAEVVTAWEASDKSAREFAGDHGVSESSLRWWKSELGRRARREPSRRSPGPGRNRDRSVAIARVVREVEEPGEARSGVGALDDRPPSVAPQDGQAGKLGTAPVDVTMVVSVGQATIVVRRNFDVRLLRAVVQALSEPS